MASELRHPLPERRIPRTASCHCPRLKASREFGFARTEPRWKDHFMKRLRMCARVGHVVFAILPRESGAPSTAYHVGSMPGSSVTTTWLRRRNYF